MEELEEKMAGLFLKKIIDRLKDASISVDQAKTLAQEYIGMKPYSSVDDMLAKMDIFVKKHQEFAYVREYLNIYAEELKVGGVIDQMKQHMQEDKPEGLQVAQASH